MEQFCAACVRDGFDNVYQLRRRDNGWRWREAWAKSHPNPVKYVDPLEGLAVWRQEHFYEEISYYARDHFCTSKKRK